MVAGRGAAGWAGGGVGVAVAVSAALRPFSIRAPGGRRSRLKSGTIGNDIHALAECLIPYGRKVRCPNAFSFARAFLFAGVRSVLSTTMPTGEGAAIRLVDLYREELVAGHPADGALQRGKLAYLEQSDDYEDKLPIH